ncbi:MAG: triose-phosphate isomerase [Deltaproteobacteria bacterium]|nr:triose-phosphate isomerase [Deltaproteobacteria bacterium]
MGRKIIAGNWKMYKTLNEGLAFLDAFIPLCDQEMMEKCSLILAPNFTLLASMANRCQEAGITLAAQNCHPGGEGAYTGETSLSMLADIGVSHVLVGHSERRALFGEIDDFLNQKLEAVLASGLIPIFCVGESLEQREADAAESVVEKQLQQGLHGISLDVKMMVAYEPVWAIGTGKTATAADARTMHQFIRQCLVSIGSGGGDIPLLYGGSVKPANAAELLAEPDIDGVLVGGASLNPEDFARIAKSVC